MIRWPAFREVLVAIGKPALHLRGPVEAEVLGCVANVTADTKFHRASDERLDHCGTSGSVACYPVREVVAVLEKGIQEVQVVVRRGRPQSSVPAPHSCELPAPATATVDVQAFSHRVCLKTLRPGRPHCLPSGGGGTSFSGSGCAASRWHAWTSRVATAMTAQGYAGPLAARNRIWQLSRAFARTWRATQRTAHGDASLHDIRTTRDGVPF